jgi:hypothetical protein
LNKLLAGLKRLPDSMFNKLYPIACEYLSPGTTQEPRIMLELRRLRVFENVLMYMGQPKTEKEKDEIVVVCAECKQAVDRLEPITPKPAKDAPKLRAIPCGHPQVWSSVMGTR